MHVRGITLSAFLSIWVAAAASAGECPAKGGKPQVFVKAKTPIRKGPGLNYQVSSFLERGVCLPFSEVSMDKRWVLVNSDETFGWVPMGRLGPVSQAGAKTGAPDTAAVGSGQARGQARVAEQSLLLTDPDSKSAPKRVLPVDLMIVPMSTTPDGQWAEVRDERGQTGWVLTRVLRGDALADLPINEAMTDRPVAPPAGGGEIVRMRPGRGGIGVAVTAAVYAGALVPTHGFDSDGLSGRRRYDVVAVSPSTGIELEMMDLGPLSARLGYTTTFMFGVQPDVDGTDALGGNQHDLYVRAGWPIEVGPATLTPELGYRFAMFDFDSVISDQQNNVALLSTTAHVATAGARFRWFVDRNLMLEADGGAAFGATSLAPRRLDEGGGTVGAYGSVGAQFFFGDIMGLSVRYLLDWRSASYQGGGQIDPTITEGTITDLTHGMMAGLSFLLAG